MSEPLEDSDREVYVEALTALNASGVPFMLGGAFAVYHYTGWWRHTHDVDVYVAHENVADAAAALTSASFTDIGEQAEGDCEWIRHFQKGSIIIDVIWRFANLAEYITPAWFRRAPRAEFLGKQMMFLPLEEIVWIKVFVINRHRCDWPDIFRIIKAQCEQIDWDRLIGLVGMHLLLLAGLVDVFDWLHPDSAGCVPGHVRRKLDTARRQPCAPADLDRERLLDPWIYQREDGYASRRDE